MLLKLFLKQRAEKNILKRFLCGLSKQNVVNPPMAPHVFPGNDFAKVFGLVRKTYYFCKKCGNIVKTEKRKK